VRPEQIPLSVRQGDCGSGRKPCAQMSIESQKQGAGIVGAGPAAGDHGRPRRRPARRGSRPVSPVPGSASAVPELQPLGETSVPSRCQAPPISLELRTSFLPAPSEAQHDQSGPEPVTGLKDVCSEVQHCGMRIQGGLHALAGSSRTFQQRGRQRAPPQAAAQEPPPRARFRGRRRQMQIFGGLGVGTDPLNRSRKEAVRFAV